MLFKKLLSEIITLVASLLLILFVSYLRLDSDSVSFGYITLGLLACVGVTSSISGINNIVTHHR